MAEGNQSPLPQPSTNAKREGLTSTLVKFAFGILALGAILFLSHFFPVIRQMLFANDSPGEVIGGSIEIVAYDHNSPNPYGSFCDKKIPLEYCMPTYDSSKIAFDNVPGAKALVLRQGWKIHITNRGADGSEPEAIVVCSASDCSLGLGDGQTVYIRPNSDATANPPPSVWVFPNGPHEPHFHDIVHNPGTDPTKEDSKVDHIEHIWIEASGQDPQKRLTCPADRSGNHVCTIYIGPRNVSETWTRYRHHVGR